MRLVVRPLESAAAATDVLRALEQRASDRGLPPPAALTGNWFGGSTVLVPSVRVLPVEPDTAFDVIERQPEVTREPGAPEDAVGGGWIGYLGYELTDPSGARPDRPGARPDRRRLPVTAWGWTDHVLRRDRRGQWWFETITEGDSHARAEELGALVAEAAGRKAGNTAGAGTVVVPDADRHRKSVRRCVEEIADGEIFQANICSRFAVPFTGSPLELFATGSARFDPARAAYVAGDWGAVASLSPELFLARHGRVVRSSPIKGTTPRRGPEDDHNADVLRGSRKDIAENVMIVDMSRNDLGRVARTGTVTTPKLLRVEAHPGVWHLVSEVRAELPPDTGDAELLRATFPPASVTGAPKVRALEIISELESDPREVYCGAVGMSSPVGGTELNVAIRTLEYSAGEVAFGVGGGITADSDATAEWQECLTKAAPLLSLLERPGE